jgi:predicted dehydrogenase
LSISTTIAAVWPGGCSNAATAIDIAPAVTNIPRTNRLLIGTSTEWPIIADAHPVHESASRRAVNIDALSPSDSRCWQRADHDSCVPVDRPPERSISAETVGFMGIHDFDLARWFMGEVRSVHAVGGALVFPELGSVGDIDNAVISLVFADGRLGVVDLSRNGVYGYDITTEVLCTKGTVRVGYLRETPLLVMTTNHVAHDTVPYFMERFEKAYTAQLRDFANNVLGDASPSVSIDDGIRALRLGLAATRAHETRRAVDLVDEARTVS